jgi:hypothetical protein
MSNRTASKPLRPVVLGLTALWICLSAGGLHPQEPAFPLLANYYLHSRIEREDVRYFSGWDLHIFNWYVDRDARSRQHIQAIRYLGDDPIFLIYHLSIGVNTTVNPPDPLETAAETWSWWLQDYQGNPLYGQYPWEFNRLVNFTDEEAATGTHPSGMRANSLLPEILDEEHLAPYAYWDGVFYDVFSDNLGWMYTDVKDANVNFVPEFDSSHNKNEPIFDVIWRNGMISLVENTLRRVPDAIIVGNGLHRWATRYLNGRMFENYRRSSNSLSDLSSLVEYAEETGRDRPVIIVDGAMLDPDFRDFRSFRFGLVSALLIDAYYSSWGTTSHRDQVLWFDEYAVRPGGRVSAVTATLTSPVDEVDTTLRVDSADAFPESGVITLDGEQIHYASRTATTLEGCARGYPHFPEGIRTHDAGATVIHYLPSSTGWLGRPTSEAFDAADPSVHLRELMRHAGWFAPAEIAAEIDSRVWVRAFQNGVVVLNPTSATATIDLPVGTAMRKISGIQDPVHNDGSRVTASLTVPSKDGYLLLYDEPFPSKE